MWEDYQLVSIVLKKWAVKTKQFKVSTLSLRDFVKRPNTYLIKERDYEFS